MSATSPTTTTRRCGTLPAQTAADSAHKRSRGSSSSRSFIISLRPFPNRYSSSALNYTKHPSGVSSSPTLSRGECCMRWMAWFSSLSMRDPPRESRLLSSRY
ncbi:hypothetical protein PMAYCL1PPCAC_08728, partial [Pristionchus mayeri]